MDINYEIEQAIKPIREKRDEVEAILTRNGEVRMDAVISGRENPSLVSEWRRLGAEIHFAELAVLTRNMRRDNG